MFSRVQSIATKQQTAEQKYSLINLKTIHQQLVENKVITPANEDFVVESLYTIAEMVVYGDRKSELLFDFFCEKNMLSLFLELMWAPHELDGGFACPIRVHIQILQTLSILFNSVKNDTSLYYLLSNNYINEIIIFPHNFEVEESLRDQFVSFLKTLSLRLNPQTVQFFFVEETGAFPLLSRAIDMMHFTETMVRVASQTTILNILQVQDKRARTYALQDEIMFNFLTKVVHIINRYFETLIRIANEYLAACKRSMTNEMDRLENQADDILSSVEDWTYFLQDLLGLRIMKLRRAAISFMLLEFIYPKLLSSFLSLSSNVDTNIVDDQHIIDDNEMLNLKSKETESNITSESFLSSNISPRSRKEVLLAHGMNRLTLGGQSNSIKADIETHEKLMDQLESSPRSMRENNIKRTVSLHILSQMFRIIQDSMFQRALSLAIEHPLSSQGRKNALLQYLIDTNEYSNEENKEELVFHLNEYREKLGMIISSSIGNLSILGNFLFFHSTMARIKESSQNIEDENTRSKAILFTQVLKEWNYDIDNNTNTILSSQKVTSDNTIRVAESPMTPLNPLGECFTSPSPLPSTKPMNLEAVFEDQSDVTLATESLDVFNENTADIMQSVRQVSINFDLSSHMADLIDIRESEVSTSISRDQTLSVNSTSGKLGSVSFPKRDKTPVEVEDIDIDHDGFEVTPRQQTRSESFDENTSTSIVNIDAEIMSMDKILVLHKTFHNKSIQKVSVMEEKLFEVLRHGLDKYPLVTLQIVAHTLYGHILLLRQEIEARSSTNSSHSNFKFVTTSNSVFVLPSTEYLMSLMKLQLNSIFKCGILPAKAIFSRLDSQVNDVILDIIYEELKRMEGSMLWTSYQGKVLQDAQVFFSNLQGSITNAGLEYSLASSQLESVRREVQIFILIRSLYIQTKRTITSPNDNFSIDDICSRASDDVLWAAFLAKFTVPHEYKAGVVFKMKGKRYLDVRMSEIQPNKLSSDHSQSNNTNTNANTNTDGSSILSSFTFGYLGVNDKKKTNVNASRLSFSPIKQSQQTNELPLSHYGNILFVQDRTYLLIIKPDDGTYNPQLGDISRGTFKVFICSPLIHTDISIDDDDKLVLKIIVRSWDYNHPNMKKIGSDSDSSKQNVAGLLKPRSQSSLYQVNIGFDSEQACALAAEHLEGRRQAIRAEKLKLLRKGLESWISGEKKPGNKN